MQLLKNKDKNHRVYTIHSSMNCDDVVEFMKERMSFLVQGYPKTVKQGTVLFENKLWEKCKSTFEKLNDKSVRLYAELYPRPEDKDVFVHSLIKVNPYIPFYKRPNNNFTAP